MIDALNSEIITKDNHLQNYTFSSFNDEQHFEDNSSFNLMLKLKEPSIHINKVIP